MQEISTNQPPLCFGEGDMPREGLFHFVGAAFEFLDQLAMATVEILQNIREKAFRRPDVECQDPFYNHIRPRFIDRLEVSGLDRRPERAHDDARRVGSQEQRLPVQENGLAQGDPNVGSSLMR